MIAQMVRRTVAHARRPHWIRALAAVALATCTSDATTRRDAVVADSSVGVVSTPGNALELDGVIDRELVIFVEATDSEVAALEGTMTLEDFHVVADDMSFYRSTAIEYLEKDGYPHVRVIGRRPLRFLVAGAPKQYEFREVELLDFVIAYEPGQEPQIVAANEVEAIREYFRKRP